MQTDCPGEREIEGILLHAKKHPLIFETFQQHVVTCNHCSRVVKRLHLFYEILEKELQKPASPKVVSFAKSLYTKVQSK